MQDKEKVRHQVTDLTERRPDAAEDKSTKNYDIGRRSIRQAQRVSGSAQVCIIFYVVVYLLFYTACALYPNKLKESLTYALFWYLPVSVLAVLFFLTAGSNPGEPSSMSRGATIEIQDDIELNRLGSHKESPYQPVQSVDSDAPPILISLGSEEPPMPEQRFCQACKVYQPYRSRHCGECQKCVLKFDHHCFWIGGCVGELNHRKFWAFLFFQTLQELQVFAIARSGHLTGKLVFEADESQRNHVEAVWMFFLVVGLLFAAFTGVLLGYHTYLIISGQTTWEHASRSRITYLKPYKPGQNPFYLGVVGNVRQTFLHGGRAREWVLLQPTELYAVQGFNWCDNEYYSCC